MEDIKKDRSIARIDADVKNVLDWKVKHYQDNNIPIGVIADYIHKGIEEIDLKIEQLKNYKKMIDKEIADLGTHKEVVKTKAAEWFNENGFEKLEGVEVSSITLTKPSEAKEESVVKKEFKCSLSKDEINDLLVGQNLAEYIKTDSIKITPAKPSIIRINKKRK